MQLYKVILLNFLIYIEVIIERKFYICGCSMRKNKRPRVHVGISLNRSVKEKKTKDV